MRKWEILIEIDKKKQKQKKNGGGGGGKKNWKKYLEIVRCF